MRNTYMETQIVRKGGHYEVYVDGAFVCSADTVVEAAKELDLFLEERRSTEEWTVSSRKSVGGLGRKITKFAWFPFVLRRRKCEMLYILLGVLTVHIPIF